MNPPEQYATAANLGARIALHRFSTNPYGWSRWVFDHLLRYPLRDILEVGAGPGTLWYANRDRISVDWCVTLTDQSAGMAQEAEQRLGYANFTYQVADVLHLPFPDASFDAVIANHMLYHVPDRPAAFREISRVLRPGGRIFAATNGMRHFQEINPYIAQIVPAMPLGIAGASARFGLENGAAYLTPCFADVTLEEYPDGLRVPEVEPLIAYIRSVLPGTGITIAPETEAALRAEFARQIAEHGAVAITKATGIFLARKAMDNEFP